MRYIYLTFSFSISIYVVSSSDKLRNTSCKLNLQKVQRGSCAEHTSQSYNSNWPNE